MTKSVLPKTDRYDFSFWPPMPLEAPSLLPAQSANVDQVCEDVLYAPNEGRRRAIYGTGDWADIADFWLESDAPKDSETYIDDLGFVHVKSRKHLSSATYAFHQLMFQLARWEALETAEIEGNTELMDELSRYRHVTVAQKFLFYEACSPFNKTTSSQHLLVARSAIVAMLDAKDSFPGGTGEKGRLIIAKAALRWSVSIDSLGH